MSEAGEHDLLMISKKLNNDIITEALKKATGLNDCKLLKYRLTECSTRGNGYLSTITRMSIYWSGTGSKEECLRVILKSLPSNIGWQKTFRCTDFFRNEVAFYDKVWPRMHAFQEKKKKIVFEGIPKCLMSIADGENDFIVMEDLSHQGYKTVNRMEGLDIFHCLATLSMLAKFHALSFALKDQEPEEFFKTVGYLEETYYSKKLKHWNEGMVFQLNNVVKDAMSKELPGSKYERKLLNFANEKLYDTLCELVLGKEPYAVISHGDCWSPNLLLKYADSADGDKIESVKLIDFQLSRYSSPAVDLSFFLYSCTTEDLRKTKYDFLLQHYYRELTSTLTDLGTNSEKVFPYKAYQNEIQSYFAFGLGMSLGSVPFSLLSEDEAPDLGKMKVYDAIPLTDIWIVKPIKEKSGRLRVVNNVIHAVDSGYI